MRVGISDGVSERYKVLFGHVLSGSPYLPLLAYRTLVICQAPSLHFISIYATVEM